MGSYREYSKQDQTALAAWSLDCAERVLPLFEAVNAVDERPRRALEVGREWARTGVFAMTVIRKASLDAHAAAREAAGSGAAGNDSDAPGSDAARKDAACFAARAAGQAVATAHVPQHAYGGAYYALKAIAAANPQHAREKVAEELDWQSRALPEHLRHEIMSRIIVDITKAKIRISIDKGEGF